MHKINKVELRSLQLEDYTQLSQSFKRVYADKDVFWTRKQIETLIRIFPEGQVVTLVDDRIVGCALSIIVDYDMVKGDHTYAKVTGNETFSTHNPNGNILYGIEMFIHPDYRGSGWPPYVRVPEGAVREVELEGDHVRRTYPELL